MIARDRDYPELRDVLSGKRVLIWTCNTCARLCNDIGGTDAAKRLSEALKNDGIDVVGIMFTHASCLEKSVKAKEDMELLGKVDVIVSLTCDTGSICVSSVFHKKVINPIVTFGPGCIREDGSLVMWKKNGEFVTYDSVADVASKIGLKSEPFV